MKTAKIKGNIEVTKEELEEALARLNEPEFDYPLVFRSKLDGLIVLFDGLQSGVVVKGNADKSIGYECNFFREHTDRTIWEPYDKERGFYHGQQVYAWDNVHSHRVIVGFYDAINKCLFSIMGALNGCHYDNYSATKPEFMNNAYDTLRGINSGS